MKPLLDPLGPNGDIDTVEGIIALAALVWNLGSLGSKDPEIVEKTLREIESAGTEIPITRAAAEELLRRRRELYPHDQRIVRQFQVSKMPGGGFHVIAASRLANGGDPIV